jgi:hypothetical protein
MYICGYLLALKGKVVCIIDEKEQTMRLKTFLSKWYPA